MTNETFEQMASRVWDEEVNKYVEVSFYLRYATRIKAALEGASEPVGWVGEFGDAHWSGSKEGFPKAGTKLYTRANLPPAEQEEKVVYDKQHRTLLPLPVKEELERLRGQNARLVKEGGELIVEIEDIREELTTANLAIALLERELIAERKTVGIKYLEVVTENGQLRAENDGLRKENASYKASHDAYWQECDRLRAENESNKTFFKEYKNLAEVRWQQIERLEAELSALRQRVPEGWVSIRADFVYDVTTKLHTPTAILSFQAGDFEARDKWIAAAQGEQLVHTDHPSRHWDRTCPACIAQGEQPK